MGWTNGKHGGYGSTVASIRRAVTMWSHQHRRPQCQRTACGQAVQLLGTSSDVEYVVLKPNS